jgi:hypothetical protein
MNDKFSDNSRADGIAQKLDQVRRLRSIRSLRELEQKLRGHMANPAGSGYIQQISALRWAHDGFAGIGLAFDSHPRPAGRTTRRIFQHTPNISTPPPRATFE